MHLRPTSKLGYLSLNTYYLNLIFNQILHCCTHVLFGYSNAYYFLKKNLSILQEINKVILSWDHFTFCKN